MNGPDTPAERLRNTLASFAYSPLNAKPVTIASSSPQVEPSSAKTGATTTYAAGSDTPARRRLIRKERGDGIEEDGDGSSRLDERSPPKKPKRSYADPSVYAHLRGLNDYLRPGLDVVFCGINPGERSATLGHHFANPTNHFWGCLYEAGFTPTQLKPSEDSTLPERFNLGMTNLISRPTAEAAELSKAEMQFNVPTLLSKITKFKPKIVCVVGVGIAEAIHSYLSKCTSSGGKSRLITKRKAEATTISSTTSIVKLGGPGLLPFKLVHDLDPPVELLTASANTSDLAEAPLAREVIRETLFYAVSSTSGRVVRYQKTEKIKQFQKVKALLIELQQDQGVSAHGLKATASETNANVVKAPCTDALIPIYASTLNLM